MSRESESGASSATQPLISRRDWDMIGLMLQEDSPRKSAALIYTKLKQTEQASLPAEFDTDARWDRVCTRLCTAAAAGNANPSIQQSAHLLSVVAETAAEFDSVLQPTGRKRKSKARNAASSDPPPKKRKASERTKPSTWEELRVEVEGLLGLIGQDIKTWLEKDDPLALWTPPSDSSWHLPQYRDALNYISTLRLPRTPAAASGACLADLLLYKVGSTQELDPHFTEKKKEVMAGNSHQAVANVSGAGKSRLTLDVLAEDWSFYFMSDYNQIVNPYGSQDVKAAIADLLEIYNPSGYRFSQQLPMVRGNGRGVSIAGLEIGLRNAAMARHLTSAVLLARILVHDQFLGAYHGLSARTREHVHGPKMWLLLQAVPVLHGRDIFLEVYRLVKSLSSEAIEQQIQNRLHAWESSNHVIVRVGVDEIQHLVDTYPSAFIGSPKNGHEVPTRPFFKPFISTLSDFLLTSGHNVRFLFVGTRLCFEGVTEALISTAVKSVELQNSSVTSSHFDMQPGAATFDPAPIIQYLSHFLTGPVVADFGNLLNDIFFWLRGRPRFLAYFVQWVLQKGPRAARQVLMNIVSKLTDIELHICSGPGEAVENIAEMQLRRLLSSTLTKENISKHNEPIRVIVQALLNLLIEGRYTKIDENHEILVEFGVGKFEETTTSCWIRENLVLARLFTFFATAEGSETFVRAVNEGLRHPEPSTAGFAMENALLWMFWQLFTTSTPTLASFLQFFGTSNNNTPAWAKRPARLVWYFDGDQPIPASSSKFAIGLAATGAKPRDTLSWLNNETRLPFLKPDKRMGPDVCFRVSIPGDSPGKYQVIMICVQGKYGLSELSDAKFRKAVSTVTPAHFYRTAFTSRREDVLQCLPTWETPHPTPLSSTNFADDELEDDSSDSTVEQAVWDSDIEIEYPTYGERDFAIVRVLATTRDVQKFVDMAEGLGELPLAVVKLQTFHDAVNNFQMSGFKAALEAADASLAKSYATLRPTYATRRTTAQTV